MNAKEAMRTCQTEETPPKQGCQRLFLERLREWESLGVSVVMT
jgi:hypothetical protein